jgi:serine protease
VKRLPLLLVALLCGACPMGEDPVPDAGAPTTGTVTGRLTVFPLNQSSARDVSLAPALPLGIPRALLEQERPSFPSLEAARIPRGEEFEPGEVLVMLDTPDVVPEKALLRMGMAGFRAQHAGHSSRSVHVVRFSLPDGGLPSQAETRQLEKALSGRPGVRATALNRRVYPTAVPNDTHYSHQWHYAAMNLPAAWDITTSSGSVVVAVVDTGIRLHSDLKDRILPGVDTISSATNAQDGDGRDTDPTDMGGDRPNGGSSWHGTHVAGTVGATTNNGKGVAGVSWNARILPVRVLGKSGGLNSDIIAGIEWAIGEQVPGLPLNPAANRAQVINLSLGGDGAPDPIFQELIDRATARGVVFVIAAGNEDENTSQKMPCNQSKVICVGGTRFSGKRASYSNYGTQVDVMAPGGESAEDQNSDGYQDGILSTSFDGTGKEIYGFQQGTSMATPHVAGLVALMKASNPDLTPSQVEGILKETASTSSLCSEGCGAGLVNAQAALLRASGLSAPTGPAQLTLTSQGLYLVDKAPTSLTLINSGGAGLQVQASFTARTPGAKVLFPRGASVSIAAGQSAQLEVAADTTGLANGSYEGELRLVPSEGAAQTLSVRIRVGPSPQDKPARLVFAYEDAQGEWKRGGLVEVLPSSGYTYSLQLPPGTYYALAAIDENGNQEYFEPGERVGFYPSMSNPEPLVVTAGGRLANIDFALVPYTEVGEEAGLLVGGPCTGNADCPGGCATSPCPAATATPAARTPAAPPAPPAMCWRTAAGCAWPPVPSPGAARAAAARARCATRMTSAWATAWPAAPAPAAAPRRRATPPPATASRAAAAPGWARRAPTAASAAEVCASPATPPATAPRTATPPAAPWAPPATPSRAATTTASRTAPSPAPRAPAAPATPA